MTYELHETSSYNQRGDQLEVGWTTEPTHCFYLCYFLDSSQSRFGHGILMGTLLGVAGLAVLLISILGGVLIMKRRRATYDTSSNVKVLSMENIVDTN